MSGHLEVFKTSTLNRKSVHKPNKACSYFFMYLQKNSIDMYWDPYEYSKQRLIKMKELHSKWGAVLEFRGLSILLHRTWNDLINSVWIRLKFPGGPGPRKVLKMLDFQAWEGPKVLKLLDPGKFRGGHGLPGPPSYPDAVNGSSTKNFSSKFQLWAKMIAAPPGSQTRIKKISWKTISGMFKGTKNMFLFFGHFF